jgi:hypothetical protein
LAGELEISQYVGLFEAETASYLFCSSNRSQFIRDAELTIGQHSGQFNEVFGNSSGILRDDFSYELTYNFHINNQHFFDPYVDRTDEGSEAMGNLTFTVGETVPEPSTSMIWFTFGAIGCAFSYWRKRHHRNQQCSSRRANPVL